MKVVETVAPIPISELKIFFEDKDLIYKIDYEKSQLKGEQLLTYLSNLELPCDLSFNNNEDLYSLLKEYLVYDRLVEIPILIKLIIDVLLQKRELTTDMSHLLFIEENKEILNIWEERLDALTLYNFYIVNSERMKNFVTSHGTVEREETTKGINFVHLLNKPLFFEFYRKINRENLKYYPKYFNDYIFNGKNLYKFWANPLNPLFLVHLEILTKGMERNPPTSSAA